MEAMAKAPDEDEVAPGGAAPEGETMGILPPVT
jgi:hypothetical protein